MAGDRSRNSRAKVGIQVGSSSNCGQHDDWPPPEGREPQPLQRIEARPAAGDVVARAVCIERDALRRPGEVDEGERVAAAVEHRVLLGGLGQAGTPQESVEPRLEGADINLRQPGPESGSHCLQVREPLG